MNIPHIIKNLKINKMQFLQNFEKYAKAYNLITHTTPTYLAKNSIQAKTDMKITWRSVELYGMNHPDPALNTNKKGFIRVIYKDGIDINNLPTDPKALSSCFLYAYEDTHCLLDLIEYKRKNAKVLKAKTVATTEGVVLFSRNFTKDHPLLNEIDLLTQSKSSYLNYLLIQRAKDNLKDSNKSPEVINEVLFLIDQITL